MDFGDFGFWILGILDFGDFGFWIFGILGILDFGFLEHYVADLYVQSLDFGIWGFWILDFGDFGFWILGILDFGFWGSWILDFGLGILDGHLVTKFWMLHKKRRLCTPNRVGGLQKLRPFQYLSLTSNPGTHGGFEIVSSASVGIRIRIMTFSMFISYAVLGYLIRPRPVDIG